jgi:hypothetical protein
MEGGVDDWAQGMLGRERVGEGSREVVGWVANTIEGFVSMMSGGAGGGGIGARGIEEVDEGEVDVHC